MDKGTAYDAVYMAANQLQVVAASTLAQASMGTGSVDALDTDPAVVAALELLKPHYHMTLVSTAGIDPKDVVQQPLILAVQWPHPRVRSALRYPTARASKAEVTGAPGELANIIDALSSNTTQFSHMLADFVSWYAPNAAPQIARMYLQRARHLLEACARSQYISPAHRTEISGLLAYGISQDGRAHGANIGLLPSHKMMHEDTWAMEYVLLGRMTGKRAGGLSWVFMPPPHAADPSLGKPSLVKLAGY